MAESSARKIWTGRGVYLLLSFLIIFFQLLPLETFPTNWGNPGILPIDPIQPGISGTALADPPEISRRWGSPDFLLLVTLIWAARRPSYLPATLVAAIFLLADAVFLRPLGLWAALVLILSEILRGRARGFQVLPFPLEWLTVASGIVAITLIYRFTLALVLVPQAPLGLTLVQLALTIIAYPPMVFLAYLFFGVNRPAQGELDALGHRL